MTDMLSGTTRTAQINKSEAYWTERNALVAAVLAIDPGEAFMASGWDAPGAAELRAAYSAALDRLAAFDAANGGAPVL